MSGFPRRLADAGHPPRHGATGSDPGHANLARQIVTMCALKLRLAWQHFAHRTSLTRRILSALFMLWMMAGVIGMVSEAPSFIQKAILLESATRWLLGLLLGYFLVTTIAADLILGHTLNIGQMSHDQPFLATLPLRPATVLAMRLFERMITDFIGVIMLLGGFIGLACHRQLSVAGFAWGAGAYAMVASGVGLAVVLASVVLQRLFRPAALNNAFSLISYLSALIGVIPYAWFSSDPTGMLRWLVAHRHALGGAFDQVMTPWLGLIDLLMAPGEAPYRPVLLTWVGWMAAGTAAYLALDRLGWTRWVHPGVHAPAQRTGRRWLTGFAAKEALQVRHDMNLLTNAVLLPLTIIVFEVVILKDLLGLTTAMRLFNALAGAVMYFCLFGPMNSIGAEQRAIALIETLPVTPWHLLWTKARFWAAIAALIFLPITGIVFWHFGHPAGTVAGALAGIALLLAAFVWTAVCCSAIFANFDAKVLQQASTLSGKWLALMAMGTFAPVRGLDPLSLQQLAVALLLAWSLSVKAHEALAGRLDTERFITPEFRFADGFLAVVVFLAWQGMVAGAVRPFADSATAGLWPWLLAWLVGVTGLAGYTWGYTRERFPSPGRALGICLPDGAGWWPLGFGIAAVSAGFARLYLPWADTATGEVFAPTARIWEALVAVAGPGHGLAIVIAVLVVIAPLVEELFFRGFLGPALADRSGGVTLAALLANGALFALIHPWLSMPPVFVLGVGCAWLRLRSGSILPAVLAHAVYNAAIVGIHAWRIANG